MVRRQTRVQKRIVGNKTKVVETIGVKIKV